MVFENCEKRMIEDIESLKEISRVRKCVKPGVISIKCIM